MVTAAKVYVMLGNESLWSVAQRCSELFHKAGKGSEVKIAVPEGDLNVEEIEDMSVVRFSRFLHKSVRSTFRELVRHATAGDE